MLSTAQGYINGAPEQAECAPAPLDEQVRALHDNLREMSGLLEGLEASLPLRTIRPDKPDHIEGLTALVAACHQEVGGLRIALGGLVQRIGRL